MHGSDFCVQPMARRAAPFLAVGRFFRLLYRRFVSGEQAWSAELFHWRRRGVFRGARHVFHLHVAIWPTSELADRRVGISVGVRMACHSNHPARRLADRRGCEFLFIVFMCDIGGRLRYEGPMAAKNAVSVGRPAIDIFRCDDCPKQFSRHETQRAVDHSDVCGVACLHAGIMGGVHDAGIVYKGRLAYRK